MSVRKGYRNVLVMLEVADVEVTCEDQWDADTGECNSCTLVVFG